MLPAGIDSRKIEIIDRIANLILDLNLDDYAAQMFEAYGSFEVLGQTAFVSITPIMTALWGVDGFDTAQLMALDPREGSTLIIKRLKELKAEREKEKVAGENVSLLSSIKSLLSRIKSLLSRKKLKSLED
jgi:hypothetical protein